MEQQDDVSLDVALPARTWSAIEKVAGEHGIGVQEVAERLMDVGLGMLWGKDDS